jgi:hypothetical protein
MGKTLKTDKVNFGGKNFDYGPGAQLNKAPTPKPRSKFTPKGIDPAYPNRNFVKMSYTNRGDDQGFWDYMYSPSYPGTDANKPGKKSSGWGHGIGQRAGKLRLSGNKSAHRLGKRGK